MARELKRAMDAHEFSSNAAGAKGVDVTAVRAHNAARRNSIAMSSELVRSVKELELEPALVKSLSGLCGPKGEGQSTVSAAV